MDDLKLELDNLLSELPQLSLGFLVKLRDATNAELEARAEQLEGAREELRAALGKLPRKQRADKGATRKARAPKAKADAAIAQVAHK